MRVLAALLALLPLQESAPSRLTREKEGRWTGPFFFVQAADPQFGMMDPEQERKNAERAVEHINRLKPKFAILCGDLVNPPPGQKGYEEKVTEFKRIFGKVDPAIPLLLVPGNHDVGNKPTPESLKTYRRDFGEDYYAFWAAGVRGIVLNSTLYHDPSGAPEAQARQEEWLARRIEEATREKPRHLLVFQHHAWFLNRPDEKDGYFNLPLARRGPALAAFKDAGVRAVFAGHYHGNAHGRDGDLEMITTGPIGKPLRKDPSGLRIVEVYEDRLRHAYYGLDEVPASVELKK